MADPINFGEIAPLPMPDSTFLPQPQGFNNGQLQGPGVDIGNPVYASGSLPMVNFGAMDFGVNPFFGGGGGTGYDTTPTNYDTGARPGAGAPGAGPLAMIARLARGALGGQVGLGIAGGREALAAINRAIARGQVSGNMRGANDLPPGSQPAGNSLSNLFANLFGGGQPFNQENYANYTRPYQHGTPFQGTNAFDRSGNNIYSDQTANRAQSAENLTQMANVARTGFGSNFTGTTQDAGHTIFGTGPQSHFRGEIVDGVLQSVPTSYSGRSGLSQGYGGSLADPRVIAALGGAPVRNPMLAAITGAPPAFPFTVSPPPVAALPPGYGGGR